MTNSATPCRLVHVPASAVPWQDHALHPWRCEITGQQTAYLAGFATQGRALQFIAEPRSRLRLEKDDKR